MHFFTNYYYLEERVETVILISGESFELGTMKKEPRSWHTVLCNFVAMPGFSEMFKSVYSKMFKSACPRSYSYAYNDGTSTFTCSGADYTITFCSSTTRYNENNLTFSSL